MSLIGIAGFVLVLVREKRKRKKYKVVYVDIYIQQQICGKLLLYICILSKKKSMMLNDFLYLNKEEKWKQTTG